MRCGGRRCFSGPVQGDAAAEVEEDKGRGGGVGARAAEKQCEEEDDRGRRMGRPRSHLFIRRR